MRSYFLCFVVLGFLVSCGVEETAPPGEPTLAPAAVGTEEGAAVTATVPSDNADAAEASTETADQGQSGVRGVVSAYSDVGSQPDEPLAQQTVVLLPLQAAAPLLGAASSPTDRELRFLHTTIQEPDRRITLAVSDAAGRYDASLAPGDYVLCLADAAGPTPTDYPLSVRGCGAFTVRPGEVSEVDVSSGFGEIVLEE